MPTNITSTQEGVLCFFQDGELVAILRRNGTTEFYAVKKMGFEEIANMFGTQVSTGKH